ncbi:MAG: hypothetical protein IPJ04_07530 [Candidatus Eisenbacteria bacterium]|nr:hypothetical protein [Candidatus Eisenbacteria bacterium]
MLRGPWGWSLFGIIWTLAAAGIVFKTSGGFRWPKLSNAIYLAMGAPTMGEATIAATGGSRPRGARVNTWPGRPLLADRPGGAGSPTPRGIACARRRRTASPLYP